MPRRVVPLSDAQVRTAKPGKHTDGNGLYLLALPHSKRWYLRTKDATGLERTFSVGKYPETSLAVARRKAQEIKECIVAGEDALPATFKTAALAWHAHVSAKWTEHHSDEVLRAFEHDLFTPLGSSPPLFGGPGPRI